MQLNTEPPNWNAQLNQSPLMADQHIWCRLPVAQNSCVKYKFCQDILDRVSSEKVHVQNLLDVFRDPVHVKYGGADDGSG